MPSRAAQWLSCHLPACMEFGINISYLVFDHGNNTVNFCNKSWIGTTLAWESILAGGFTLEGSQGQAGKIRCDHQKAIIDYGDE
uniref:Uncharacterized protein n=1 Tax=Oryza meridionalis TaxID=40149 RepID=A0A0E0EV53_9ORYZ